MNCVIIENWRKAEVLWRCCRASESAMGGGRGVWMGQH